MTRQFRGFISTLSSVHISASIMVDTGSCIKSLLNSFDSKSVIYMAHDSSGRGTISTLAVTIGANNKLRTEYASTFIIKIDIISDTMMYPSFVLPSCDDVLLVVEEELNEVIALFVMLYGFYFRAMSMLL